MSYKHNLFYNVLTGSMPLRLLLLPLLFALSIAVNASVLSEQRTVTVNARFAMNMADLHKRNLTIDDPSAFKLLPSLEVIDSVVVTGSASPDGPTKWNQYVAESRLNTIDTWLTFNLPVYRLHINRRAEISNWQQLLTLIENSYDMPNQGRAEYALRNILHRRAAGADYTDKQITRALKRKAGRKGWRYITSNLLPRMRTGEVVVYYRTKVESPDLAVRFNLTKSVNSSTSDRISHYGKISKINNSLHADVEAKAANSENSVSLTAAIDAERNPIVGSSVDEMLAKVDGTSSDANYFGKFKGKHFALSF